MLSYSAKTVQYFYEYSQETILRQQYLIQKLISKLLFEDENMSNLQNNQGQGQPSN
ncbi:hypothetical protein RhiirA5_447935 [Rhizophagus irregularis]|uniref:Uncharacterized protein n=1 Tax=Rhizophagus irregularis TaxID=588596 RepID=A0A2N0NAV3_9GLOM|nr:hypothetical protein RhiirA5_447935 [Rhizophagus irregularis]